MSILDLAISEKSKEEPGLEGGLRVNPNVFSVNASDLDNEVKVHKYTVYLLNEDHVDIRDILLKRFPVHFVNKVMYKAFEYMLDYDYDNEQHLIKELTDKPFALFNYGCVLYSTVMVVDEVAYNGLTMTELIGENLLQEVGDNLGPIRFEMRYSGIVESEDYGGLLDAVTWKSVIADEKMNYYQTEAYRTDAERISGDCHLLSRGYEKYCFAGADSQFFVQIIPQIMLFYPKITLLNYICEYYSKSEAELVEFLRSGAERERLEILLHGIMVQCNDDNRTFIVENVSDRIKIKSDGREISVSDFYFSKHGTTVRPDLQCIIDVVSGKKFYYPLSVLNILEGQIKRPSMLDSPLRIENFQNCCSINIWNAQSEMQSTARNLIREANAVAAPFGMSFSDQPVSVRAKILQPPEVMYGLPDEKYAQSQQFTFPTRNVDFAISNFSSFSRPIDLSSTKCAIYCYDSTYMSTRKQEIFLKKVYHYGWTLRWHFPERVQMHRSPRPGVDLYKWGQRLSKQIREDKYKLVIFILPDGSMGQTVRSIIKLFEGNGNYISVCVKPTDASITESKLAPVILNIVHKVNARLGGVNYELAFPQLRTRRPVHADVIYPQDNSRQYFGFHVRQIDATFHSISVAYTINDSFLIKGLSKIEPASRPEYVFSTMEDEITRGLTAYLDENGFFPADIILFLHLSQFEFQTFESDESLGGWIPTFTKTFDRQKKKFPLKNFNSRWHIVTMVTDDGCCLFPPSTREESVIRAGLCVDEVVVATDKPQFLLMTASNDFFAVAQTPIRCTVFSSDAEAITLGDFEYITFYLCCTHPTKRRPTQFPLPLTAAMDLNQRTFDNVDTLKRYPERDDGGDEPAPKRNRHDDLEEKIDPFDEKFSEVDRADALSRKVHPSTQFYYCA